MFVNFIASCGSDKMAVKRAEPENFGDQSRHRSLCVLLPSLFVATYSLHLAARSSCSLLVLHAQHLLGEIGPCGVGDWHVYLHSDRYAACRAVVAVTAAKPPAKAATRELKSWEPERKLKLALPMAG